MSTQEYNPTPSANEPEMDATPVESHQEWQLRRAREAMVLSRFQARAVLREQGLRSQVEALIDAPETDPLVVDAWNDAQELRRTSSTIATIAQDLGLTDDEVDAMFVAGAKIEA